MHIVESQSHKVSSYSSIDVQSNLFSATNIYFRQDIFVIHEHQHGFTKMLQFKKLIGINDYSHCISIINIDIKLMYLM